MSSFSQMLALMAADIRVTRTRPLKVWFNAPLRAVLAYRFYSYVHHAWSPVLAYILHNRVRRKYGVDIYPQARIGPGLCLVHLGAIVVGPGSVLGDRVTLQSCVTLGQKDPTTGEPHLGSDVYVGTGAKLLGNICVGSGAVIGANAVVVGDVPSQHVAVGVPARCFPRQAKNSDL
jgi:serine O-acetyltransferase